MPIYVYEEVMPEGQEGETFEVLQKISDPPLTVHPEKGTQVRRIVASVSIAGHWSDSTAKANLSDKKLNEKGFTKYVKMGDGVYEKRAGKGPDVISAKKNT
jgi:predicted nucleic acid-binding Zn ribbon protein